MHSSLTSTVYDNVAFELKVRYGKKGKNLARVLRRRVSGFHCPEIAFAGPDGGLHTSQAGSTLRRPASAASRLRPRHRVQPSVVLLDEPLVRSISSCAADAVQLTRLQREVGITFVYVTHDQEEALTMSDRIAVMMRVSSSRSVHHRDLRGARQRLRRPIHRHVPISCR